jgi:hypothetical protein
MKFLATTCICCTTFSFSHAVGLCEGESNPIQCSATVWRLGNSCHVVGISVCKHRTQITLPDCRLLLPTPVPERSGGKSRNMWPCKACPWRFRGIFGVDINPAMQGVKGQYADTVRTFVRMKLLQKPQFNATFEVLTVACCWRFSFALWCRVVTRVSRRFKGSQCPLFQWQSVQDNWRRTTIFRNVWDLTPGTASTTKN